MKIIVSIFLLLFNMSLYGIRCNNQLINIGDSKIKVLKACGDPKDKSIAKLKTTSGLKEARNKEKLEQWIYDFGSTKFLYIITFKKGKVVAIESQ